MEPIKSAFSEKLVRQIAGHIARHEPQFAAETFLAAVLPGLSTLELKARAQSIADALHATLPAALDRRAEVLGAAMHPDPLDHANAETDEDGICGWGILPLTMVVGQHGVPDFDRSLRLLAEMTKRFSSEFGIRYFLLADQERTLATLSRWLDDPNRHVRRLVSEGTRPRLPWAMRLPRLIADPTPVLPLLHQLRDDPEDYVRRSVANHLNDISKDHPARVSALARDWSTGAGKERRALLRHACRSLIKNGNPEALAVFGHAPAAITPVELTLSSNRLRMGETLEIAADLRSTATEPQRLVVDYVMHFLKANGRTAPKVFKGTVLTLAPGKTVQFRKRHSFRDVTTRRHYPGPQSVALRINGTNTGAVAFDLAT